MNTHLIRLMAAGFICIVIFSLKHQKDDIRKPAHQISERKFSKRDGLTSLSSDKINDLKVKLRWKSQQLLSRNVTISIFSDPWIPTFLPVTKVGFHRYCFFRKTSWATLDITKSRAQIGLRFKYGESKLCLAFRHYLQLLFQERRAGFVSCP